MEVSPPLALGIFLAGLAGGGLGGMVGIGGGVIVVPALSILFGVDIRVAVAASLVGIVGVSLATAGAEVERANFRLGTTLVIPAMVGGLIGGALGTTLPPDVVAAVFGVVLLLAAYFMLRPAPRTGLPVEVPARGPFTGRFHDVATGTEVHYATQRLWAGLLVSLGAGIMSGLTGIGGGVVIVPTMALAMAVPYKVAGATSHYMVGLFALAGISVYSTQGFLHPYVAGPTALGMILAAPLGSLAAKRVPARTLGIVLAAVLVVVAIRLELGAAGFKLG